VCVWERERECVCVCICICLKSQFATKSTIRKDYTTNFTATFWDSVKFLNWNDSEVRTCIAHFGRKLTATHCNTLQHSATYCSTLQHTATHGNTLQHTATQLTLSQKLAVQSNDTLSKVDLSWSTGWWRCLGNLKMQVSFRKRATNYRALWRTMTYQDKASCPSSPPCIKF